MPPPPAPAEPAAEPFHERPSKTQRKKSMHDLQDLGEAVAALPDSRLTALAAAGHLGDSLLEAIQTYRGTRSHEGRRRQMQYIGKLMRKADPQPIREAVAEAQLGSARESLALHQAERWREVLIAGDEAVTRWIEEYPLTDVQQLRALLRNLRKETASDVGARHSRAFRDLFKLIRDTMARDKAETDG